MSTHEVPGGLERTPQGLFSEIRLGGGRGPEGHLAYTGLDQHLQTIGEIQHELIEITEPADRIAALEEQRDHQDAIARMTAEKHQSRVKRVAGRLGRRILENFIIAL